MIWLWAIASIAGTTPPYLACSVEDGKHKVVVDIELDEGNQQALVTDAAGVTKHLPARFQKDQIAFDQPFAPGTVTTTIRRSDLSALRTATFTNLILTGSCIAQPGPTARPF